MCPPQGFRGIDIAKPCNQPLVEQRRLQRCFPSLQQRGEQLAVVPVSRGLDAKGGKHRVLIHRPFRKKHETKPARIVEDDTCRRSVHLFYVKYNMIVLGILRSREKEKALRSTFA